MAGTERSIVYNRIPGIPLKMTAAWFGYKCLLCLVYFVTYAICAIDAETTPSGNPTLTTDYSDGGFCVDNWSQHNQSCYLFTTEKYNFTEANEHCSKEGAHLVSINDEDENEFITSKSDSTDPKWIGLHRETGSCVDISSCAWMWLDESSSGYYNWPVGSLPTPSLCAILEANGFWSNRISCATKLAFICERGLWYPTTTPDTTTMMMTSDKADSNSTYSTIDEVPTMEPNLEGDDDDDTPIIIGCVVGGLVLVAIVTVVVVVLLKRHRTSSQADPPVEVTDEETPPVDKPVRYNPAYEDVETNVTFKPSPGNTDTGAPGNTDTGAHGVGDNPHLIYSEAIKKKDRPGSEGILVKENTLYGYGK